MKYYKSLIVVTVILILSFLSGDSVDKLPTIKIPHLDKVVHFFMYFGLSIILVFDLMQNSRKNIKIIFTFVIIFVIFLAGFTEIVQGSFIERRSADIFDFFADIIGSIVVLLIFKNPLIFSELHRRI